MKNNQTIVSTSIISLTLAITALYFVTQYFSLKTQQLKNDAISQCSSASVYEFTDAKKGIHVIAPNKDSYKVCLTDKGYSSIWE